jgi:hypothetical protein
MLQRRHASSAKWVARRPATWNNAIAYRGRPAMRTNQLRGKPDARANHLDRLASRCPEVPFWAKQVDLHLFAACSKRVYSISPRRRASPPLFRQRAMACQNSCGSSARAAPATSLSAMPRCQLNSTGSTWPDIASLRCVAAVKADTSSTPRGGRVVAREEVRGIVRCSELDVERCLLAGECVVLTNVEHREGVPEGFLSGVMLSRRALFTPLRLP